MTQSEGCSFVSLDPLYSLTESDIHDRQLPEGIGARWKDLARKLGFKERSIEVIEKENCTCHDRCIKLLVRWMEKAGQHRATAGKLAAALKAIELQSLADRLIGPSDRRMIMMEIQGTLHLEDRNGTEIIMGVDSTERRTFFMWKTPDREFTTSVKELKSYFDATCQISAQTPEVIEKIIGTSVRTSADVKSREDSPSAEQIPTQMPQVMEEDIAKLIEDKDRKEISTQTPDTLEEINGTSAERSQWREDSSIKVHISTQTNETDEVFRKSDETKGEDSPAKEQIGVQIPEVMKEIIRRSSEDKGQKEISTQKPDTSEEFTGTPAEKWMEDSPIKVQIRTQNPVVGEEYRPSDKTNMEDSCKKVLMSTPPSEGDVKIIGTSAEFQRKGSYHQEPISTQTSEVEKEIIGTSDEDKGLEDSFVAIQVCTQTFEVFEEVIRKPVEEMEQFSTQASEGVEENIKTGEEKVENSISKGPKISEKLKDLQEKLSVVEKNLKIPELKEEAFHVTKKLDLISRHNTTIQELYTRVTGMMREASKCDEFLREKFYDFSHRSLRAVHNNLNKSFADLQSEQGDMTTAEKRKLDSLILSRNGREKQIMYLDKILKRLFSSADEIKKSQSSPRGRGNRKISGDSKNRLRKRKTQSRVLSP